MKKTADWGLKLIHGLGWAAACLILTALLLTGAGAVYRAIRYPQLQTGVVTNKYYNTSDGWDSTWTFGSYSFTRHHGPSEGYMITVASGDHTNYWMIDEQAWKKLKVGDTVRRADVGLKR